jgi:membrane protein DedA with SNARE-associated domain
MQEKLGHLLATYGPLAAFVWGLLETDILFLVVGASAGLGKFGFVAGLAGAYAGALVHDGVLFWLSRSGADRIRRNAAYQKFGPRVEAIAQRMGPFQLFAARFIYGIRYPSVIFWGIQKMQWGTFFVVNGLGHLVWGTGLAAAGFFLADRLEMLKQNVVLVQKGVLGVVVVLLVLFWVKRLRAKKSQ